MRKDANQLPPLTLESVENFLNTPWNCLRLSQKSIRHPYFPLKEAFKHKKNTLKESKAPDACMRLSLHFASTPAVKAVCTVSDKNPGFDQGHSLEKIPMRNP